MNPQEDDTEPFPLDNKAYDKIIAAWTIIVVPRPHRKLYIVLIFLKLAKTILWSL